MNDPLQIELFSLLAKNLQEVSNDEMKNAYESFVREVEIFNQSETDYLTILRTLSFTRIEFKTLQTQILCEQGEKCA